MTAPLASSSRRALLGLAGAALMAQLPGLASAAPAKPAPPFEPRLGQHGKDVIWLPTPQALVDRLLTLAAVTPGDTLVDLGSGDGKIVISAARDFGARARGIEYDPRMVALSRHNADIAGVADRTGFVEGDIFATDFSDATVVAMYLLPHLNLRLRHTLMAMRPGTRIVTHQFHLGNWEPDETTLIAHRPGYLWIVPAQVAGTWQLNLPGEDSPTELTFTQTFQRLEGTARMGELQTTLRAPRLTGDRIAFAYTDAQGRLREFDGRVQGERLRGTVTHPNGPASFSAQRIERADVVGTEPAGQDELNAAAASLEGY